MVHSTGTTDWATRPAASRRLIDSPSGGAGHSFAGAPRRGDTTVVVTLGSIPPKDDVVRAYVSTETVLGKSLLYLSWVRDAQRQCAHRLRTQPGRQTADPRVALHDQPHPRRPPDLLRRHPHRSGAQHHLVPLGRHHWAGQQDLTAGGIAEASVNGATISDPDAGVQRTRGLFGETAINLAEISETGFELQTCRGVRHGLRKTRSSGSGGSSS